MKTRFFTALLCLLLPLIAPVHAEDYRDKLVDLARDLQKDAAKFKGKYNEYYKDLDRRERSEYRSELRQLSEAYKDQVDDLVKAAKNFDGYRRFARELDQTAAYARRISALMRVVRSGKVRDKWEDNIEDLNRLARYSSEGRYYGRGRSDDRDFQIRIYR